MASKRATCRLAEYCGKDVVRDFSWPGTEILAKAEVGKILGQSGKQFGLSCHLVDAFV